MRVAAVDAYGTAQNCFSGVHPVEGCPPSAPWAVHLADKAGTFRLLAFDLDDHGGDGAAEADARRLTEVLDAAGVESLTCRSGGGAGRHVWLGLAAGVDPQLVTDLARAVKVLCPSLDLAPLSNPATGAVRPPGAPHRAGGRSEIVAGSLEVLTSPTTTPEQLRAVARTVIGQATRAREPEEGPGDALLPADADGHRYLPGARRSLPPASAAALEVDAAATDDASAVLWTVLQGAAAARWHHADIAALIHKPGLEAARTIRITGTNRRQPRPGTGANSPSRTLARQWDRAVRHVATNPRQAGADPTFDRRAGGVAATVQAAQDRADAAPGRWRHRGGPADRRVLDQLHQRALHAVQPDVQADVRGLAIAGGVGRETARTALLRLAADGWIQQTAPGDGPTPATWSIIPGAGTIHSDVSEDRSQAVTRPAGHLPHHLPTDRVTGAGSLHRTHLLKILRARIDLAAHDVFTREALGHHLGNVLARIGENPAAPLDRGDLEALLDEGLVQRAEGGWRPVPAARDRTAAAAGTSGRLSAREAAYRRERVLWDWWLAEVAWMRAPGRNRRRHTLTQPQLTIGAPWQSQPAYPRGPDGRGDHKAAAAAHDRGDLVTGAAA